MNDNLKKRIIGIVILVIFSIILAPLLFKGSGETELKFKEIEEKDNIKFKYIDEVKKINKENILHEDKLNLNIKEKIFKNSKNIDITKKTVPNGFNSNQITNKVEVSFDSFLETKIIFK